MNYTICNNSLCVIVNERRQILRPLNSRVFLVQRLLPRLASFLSIMVLFQKAEGYRKRGEGREKQLTTLNLRPFEVGRLGGWEAGRLGGWEAGRFGGWEAGRLGGWSVSLKF